MSILKRLGRKPWVQRTLGTTAAGLMRLIMWSRRSTYYQPADIFDRVAADSPIIIAMWHGRHTMMPFIKKPEHRVKALISRHRDGEINATAAERLGIGTIRGSGDHGREFHRKGGVGAFREMLDALENGYIVALTADVPKVSRVAGLGIIKLAQMSGRKIYPVAIDTDRRIELDNWDKTVIHLPFGSFVAVAGDPISVAPGASDDELEAARKTLETNLNAATDRARAVADGHADIARG